VACILPSGWTWYGDMVGNVATDTLDRLIHERLRLGIVSALAAEVELSFGDLKQVLRTTDGNLSVHARKLEEAGYIKVTKAFAGRRPRTMYRLTAKGRRSLVIYLQQMETILTETREALERT